MTIRTQLSYLAAVVTLAMGLLALLNPLLAVRLVGLEVIDPRGLSEVRATYGMLFLVLGGGMLWSVATRPRSSSLLRFAALLWCGMALGRFLSIVIDGVMTPLNFGALALELLVGVGALLGGFERSRRRGGEALAEEEAPNALKAYRG